MQLYQRQSDQESEGRRLPPVTPTTRISAGLVCLLITLLLFARTFGILRGNIELIVLFAIGGFALFYLYLRKMLQYLELARVIPDKVRATLDTFSEGLLVVDDNNRILLANEAFASTVHLSQDELQGRRISELPWSSASGDDLPSYPWDKTRDGRTQRGVVLGIETDKEVRKLKVNCTPIVGDQGEFRGTLASFDDVSVVEKRNLKLSRMLRMLKESQKEIRRQNRELQKLATQDPLTGCLNRRSFFAEFEKQWNNAKRYQLPLSCIMVDVDHFKGINDNHGHARGDEVLRQLGRMLQGQARAADLVCRYGGEEFCLLLPHSTTKDACEAAERIRQATADLKPADVNVTVSVGVSGIDMRPKDPQELLDQADKSLYAAKRSGRNLVIAFDTIPGVIPSESSSFVQSPPTYLEEDVSIPFHAVTALISALAYRDPATAEHSRRVADLCVSLGKGAISVMDCYVLEIAALLHDIGKIGVPDSILLKPGPLTAGEWKVMQAHDRIGVEIIRAAFASEELTRIVENHHAWFAGNPKAPNLPTGHDIPLTARMLTIADSYDAIVSDRVYRKRRSPEEAFAELRRCAGIQFDPELVERFISVIDSTDPVPSVAVSKQTALRIGLQLERLAAALEERDIDSLEIRARHLRATAAKDGVTEIAELAGDLEALVASDPDLGEIVELTTELLELCRSTQSSYLVDCQIDEPSAETCENF